MAKSVSFTSRGTIFRFLSVIIGAIAINRYLSKSF